jgi:3-hydroxybutyryl-CoA dehydrogenase
MILGVVGAGSMGSGIAQLGLLAGCATTIVDPYAELSTVRGDIERDLRRGAERGRWTEVEATAAVGRLSVASELSVLVGCDIVIEAVFEDLALKRELFGSLEALLTSDCVLATNTSSIPVTAIAQSLASPERVIGMHFFNPAPLMPLVEIVAGEQSGSSALARAHLLATAMGRRAIDARDVPGFLVNRCNRPFGLEALELVTAGIAPPEVVDRIVRLGGGFRMGPFELQDLVGLDVSRDVGQSLFELSGGEPRWRPSRLLERRVQEGKLGRKSGAGWYQYPPGRPPDPELPSRSQAETPGAVRVIGDSRLATDLRELAHDAGWTVDQPGVEHDLVLDLVVDPLSSGMRDSRHALLLTHGRLSEIGGRAAVGFHAVPPLGPGGLVEVTAQAGAADTVLAPIRRFLRDCGLHCAVVADVPGLVLGRIVSQLVNEAAFALQAGIGSAADIDAGMELGVRHPRGPLGWGDVIGLRQVIGVLDALHDETGDDRYLVAPILRERFAASQSLVGDTGCGAGSR